MLKIRDDAELKRLSALLQQLEHGSIKCPIDIFRDDATVSAMQCNEEHRGVRVHTCADVPTIEDVLKEDIEGGADVGNLRATWDIADSKFAQTQPPMVRYNESSPWLP